MPESLTGESVTMVDAEPEIGSLAFRALLFEVTAAREARPLVNRAQAAGRVPPMGRQR